jgi:hypothetical protein
MDLLKNLIVDPLKAAALRIAKIAGRMHEIAAWKGGNAVTNRTTKGYKRRHKLRGKFDRKPKVVSVKPERKRYEPGTIGTSPVYDAMVKRDGTIISRRERKRQAKAEGRTFVAYYNGPGPVRGWHNVRPNKYAGRGRKRA